MATAYCTISADRLAFLGNIIQNLENYEGVENVRHAFFDDIARLMDADFGATYCWNSQLESFEGCKMMNMCESASSDYKEYYQYCDPHTFQMRAKRRAVLVEEVTPYRELAKTEFYNDFLKRDGMHHGMNIFLFDGADDLGDFRLWRAKDKAFYDNNDLMVMDCLAPHLSRAILRQSSRFAGLTARECDIACLVAKGCRDQDIARVLGISLSTVRTHISRAMEKRDCANRAELAASVAS